MMLGGENSQYSTDSVCMCACVCLGGQGADRRAARAWACGAAEDKRNEGMLDTSGEHHQGQSSPAIRDTESQNHRRTITQPLGSGPAPQHASG